MESISQVQHATNPKFLKIFIFLSCFGGNGFILQTPFARRAPKFHPQPVFFYEVLCWTQFFVFPSCDQSFRLTGPNFCLTGPNFRLILQKVSLPRKMEQNNVAKNFPKIYANNPPQHTHT